MLVAAVALGALPACEPSHADLQRWGERDDDGPERLTALVRDPRKPLALRRDAALALTRVVRRGRSVGIELLADAIEATPDRDALLAAVTPLLAEHFASDIAIEDATLYKDAACAILLRKLAHGAAKTTLETTLVSYVDRAGAESRENPRQRFSLDVMISLLGPEGARVLVRHLSASGDRGGAHRRRYAALVLAYGDAAEKAALRRELASLVRRVDRESFRRESRPMIERFNAEHALQPRKELVDGQLVRHQTAQLRDLFDAVVIAHAREAIPALLDAAFPEQRLIIPEREDHLEDDARLAAVAALERFLEDSEPPSADAFIDAATDPKRADDDPVGTAALGALAAVFHPRVATLLDRKQPMRVRRDAAIAMMTRGPRASAELATTGLPPRELSPADATFVGRALAASPRGCAYFEGYEALCVATPAPKKRDDDPDLAEDALLELRRAAASHPR